MKQLITFYGQFSAAHFYKNPEWDKTKNQQEFGLCFSENEYGHGHNYRVELSLKKTQDDLNEIQKHFNEVCMMFEHKHLNHEIEDFKTLIPTTENLALVFLKKFKQKRPDLHVRKLVLHESESIRSEIELDD